MHALEVCMSLSFSPEADESPGCVEGQLPLDASCGHVTVARRQGIGGKPSSSMRLTFISLELPFAGHLNPDLQSFKLV